MPLSDPDDFTGRYNTPIPATQQPAFNHWAATQKQATGKDPRRDMYDYDVQGDWLACAARDQRGHGSDQFKKPNHPTFSDQSQYHGIDGYTGGMWSDPSPAQPNGSYQPSQTNLTFHPPEELQEYFNKVEPGTTLLPATPMPIPTGAYGNYKYSDLSGQAPTATTPPSQAPQPISPASVYAQYRAGRQ